MRQSDRMRASAEHAPVRRSERLHHQRRLHLGHCQGTPVDDGKSCDDQNPCTNQRCLSLGWCYGGTALPDGTKCDDRNPCTTGNGVARGPALGPFRSLQPVGSPIAATSPIVVGDFNLDGAPTSWRGAKPMFHPARLCGRWRRRIFASFDGSPGQQLLSFTRRRRRLQPRRKATSLRHKSTGGNNSVGVFFGNGAGGLLPSPRRLLLPVHRSRASSRRTSQRRILDLATAYPTQNVRILLGNGSGGFMAHGSFAGGQ